MTSPEKPRYVMATAGDEIMVSKKPVRCVRVEWSASLRLDRVVCGVSYKKLDVAFAPLSRA